MVKNFKDKTTEVDRVKAYFQKNEIKKMEKKRKSCKNVDYQTRIDIIYDNQVHNIQIEDLVDKYDIGYFILRDIVIRYTETGRTHACIFRGVNKQIKVKPIIGNTFSDLEEEKGCD